MTPARWIALGLWAGALAGAAAAQSVTLDFGTGDGLTGRIVQLVLLTVGTMSILGLAKRRAKAPREPELPPTIKPVRSTVAMGANT